MSDASRAPMSDAQATTTDTPSGARAPHRHHIQAHRSGFGWGYTAITEMGEAVGDTRMRFGVLRLRAGERFEPSAEHEGALLLLHGEVGLSWEHDERGSGEARVGRASLFEEEPTALHYPPGTRVVVEAASDCELALTETDAAAREGDASQRFAPELFDAESMLESEHRGKGRLDDASYRIVRTIFDGRNRPEARLVLGEVVTFPGRWSSYPPHHHPQPEIYHYRFSDPGGYGHAELGDDVLKVQHYDTVKILALNDHAQCAAPGYGMYYIWAIRHLPGEPYTVPEFTEPHARLNDADAEVWRPSVLAAERGDVS